MIKFTSAALLSTLLVFSGASPQLGAPGHRDPDATALTAAGEGQESAHTGVTATSLEDLLDKDDYIEFARQLPNAIGLKPEQDLYFNGTLAYREGRFEDVVKPLVTAVNTHGSSLTSNQIESALEILGETAAKTFQYGSAAQMYDGIDKIFGARMGDGVKVIREKRHIGALLQHVPAQTVQLSGDFSLQRTGEEYPVSIGGKNFSAQLDTGASVSLLTESTAKSWGVTMLDGTATLHGYGGGQFSAQPGVIPVLEIGKAELRNVVVLVTADQNLYIAEIKRQTNALLGYPVASALGRLTFARDGTLTVTAHSSANERKSGTPIWIGNSSLLIGLGTIPIIDKGKVTGSTGERLFELDTGSGSTYLTDHYLAEHQILFTGKPSALARLAGAGGIHEIRWIQRVGATLA